MGFLLPPEGPALLPNVPPAGRSQSNAVNPAVPSWQPTWATFEGMCLKGRAGSPGVLWPWVLQSYDH